MRLFPRLDMPDNELLNLLVGRTTRAVRNIFQLIHNLRRNSQAILRLFMWGIWYTSYLLLSI